MPRRPPHRATRRTFLQGIAGLVFAPALIGYQTDGTAHAAGSTRDLGPQFRLQQVGAWRFNNEAYKFRFSPDGNFVALMSRREIHVLEFPSGRPVARIAESRIAAGEVFGFGFEGRAIVTLRRLPERNAPPLPEMIQVFETASGRLLDRIAPPPLDEKVTTRSIDVVASADGCYVAVKLFELRVNQPPIESAIVLLDSRDFSVISILNESAPQRSFGIHAGRMAISNAGLIGVAENDRARAMANAPQLIAIYDLRSGERLAAFPGTQEGAATVAWSPDDSLLAVGSQPLASQDRFTAESARRNAHPDAVQEAAWVWDLRARRTIISFPPIHAPVRNTAFSPDNRWLATTRAKYSRQLGSGLSVSRLSDGAEMFAYETPDHWVINEVAFSPSGRHFAFTEGREFKIFRVIA